LNASSVMANIKFELLEEECSLDECQICLNNLDANEFPIIKLACGHVYHDECINRWAYFQEKIGRENTCPTCRKTITLDKATTEKENTEVDSETDSVSVECCFSFCFAYRRRRV
jgi:hypothetical protein